MSDLERQVQSLLKVCLEAAEDLESEDWLNERFLQLEDLLLDDCELAPELCQMEQEISESWNRYSNTPVLPQEITVLNRVLHLLMTEAYDHWMFALGLTDDTVTQELVEESLAAAEWASRILSVLESLNEETQERVAA